ncbi:MAG: ribosomal-protein-alanine N-acetyltransferase [Planctomycetota bacterium]|jgi:ribosomal-protein-alanine N-acetyltransferase
MIKTSRLTLIPCTLEIFEALDKGREHLALRLKARIPENWPLFPESISYFHEPLKVDPELLGWGTWLVVLEESRTLIGEGGYGGKPGAGGQVEIGYGIMPEQRGKGFATEFAQALIDHAWEDKRVTQIEAGTLKSGDDAMASMRVLEKLGFVRSKETEESLRWALPRSGAK